MNKLFKYTIVFMAIISSGVLFPIDATIQNDHLRHIGVETFIFPTHWLFNLPSWRLLTSKDSGPLMSNAFIAPLALFGSALVWALIIFAVRKFSKGQKFDTSASQRQEFWKLCFSSSGALSVLLFLLWWSLDAATLGGYQLPFHASIVRFLLGAVSLPAFPSLLLAGALLDNGFDTPHGYEDLIIVSKTLTAFGVVIWSIVFAFVVTWLRSNKQQNVAA